MATLKNHLILYDAECPMCNLYTRAFVNSGMLESNGRSTYQHMPAGVCPVVDRQRAVNEIALVNTATGEVTYGVQSLFKVISYSFPVFRWLFSCRPFIWLASKAYSFVSYNRRVIVPSAHTDDPFEVQPTFRLGYRIAWLLFTWLMVGGILTAYSRLLAGVVPEGSSYREYLICGAQIVFQGVIISLYAPAKRWDYLGNMMTISFAGALLLLPGIIISHWVNVSPVAYTGYFMLVAGLMLLEHLRRCRLMGLGIIMSTSWVVYRLLVLAFIYLFY